MHRYRFSSTLKFILVSLLTSLLFTSCKRSGEADVSSYVDPSFGTYVSSYTAGTISSGSSIIIRLANQVDEETFNTVDPNDVISLEPGVEGKAYWVDRQTVEFKPENRLKSGSTYTVRFRIGNLLKVPSSLSNLEYMVNTIAQNYDISIENITTPDPNILSQQILTGTLVTADEASNEDVERILSALQDDNKLAISWDHSADETSHRFTINGLTRKEEESQLVLLLDGGPIGSDRSDQVNIPIPALGDFKLMSATVEQGGEQHIVLRFSDPLKTDQNLNGIITVGNLRSLNFDIRGNEVWVYPSVRQNGSKLVSISTGLRNVLDYRLPLETEIEVAFEQLKPEIRLKNSGNIIAGAEGVVFPFEAVSLRAVDVTVIKVYEDNISQFLQVNALGGDREIRRVGKPVFRRAIRLDESLTDLSKWSRYSLDLSELFEADPGALYQVKLGFKKSYSAYFCGEEQEAEPLDLEEMESWDGPVDEAESSYWDYSEQYYYYDDYDWRERDDPCSNSYFGDRRSVKRNILASNLGMVAKRGSDNSLFISVTDIKSTSPTPGVKLKVLDYQHREMVTGTTDNNGFANLAVEGRPFLVIADDGNQKGYLKVDDGSSLSMSSFNVRGKTVSRGIKGFLYGERGVWRPGDSLHISFILEDKDDLIPSDHPVVFELTDPMGKLAERLVSRNSENDFYRFSTKTGSDAPTGNWNARVTVGGAVFNKRLKIETVKPNRLKINLDFNREKITANNPRLNGNLNVTWLHGAPARNLKAVFDVTLTKGKTVFDRFGEFSFDNPENNYYSESYTVFDDKVDGSGNALITSTLVAENNPPGVLNATFTGKVYEEGGNFSIKNLTIPYYPYEQFVGIKTPKGDKARGMLLTDTTHTVNIVTLDSEGNEVDGRVNLELYKLDWRWWWDNSSYGANYVSRSYQNRLASGTVATRNGKGNWQFEINYPDWGRYYIKACDTNGGHCTGKIIYVDWPGWAGRAQRENPGGATMLSFSSDKNSYTVGENVRLDIPGAEGGRALISLENGRKVLDSYWLETNPGENQFLFKTTPDMAPGVYVNITMLQPHDQTINDLPIRMYGVIPIAVNDPGTQLKPIIEMDDVLAPGKPVEINVSESTGKRMTYTIAVVDEGLLDLTNYRTPDPWSEFYAREALGVKTWDLFGQVMGAYGGKLERLLAIGGDGDLDTENKDSEANRFKPVVQYMGPYTLESNEEVTHSFIMPQYVGSVKTMLVAGNEGAYGNTEVSTPVRQPVMILSTLPRVLGPGEQFTLPVNVFAMDAGVKNVTVEIESNDLLIPVNTSSKSARFSAPGDQVVNFEYKVAEELGIGKIKITARSKSHIAEEEIEIQVRNPNPPTTVLAESIIEAGSTWKTDFSAPGIPGTNSGYIEVSNIPPVDLSRRLQYLIRFPHGCIEQTTSAVFPQLFLSEVMELTPEKESEIENNVKQGIQKLGQFQNNSGGFSYWPGNNDVNEWGTNYAGHFLLEARKKGYDVPNSLIRSWKRYQSRAASQWKRSPSNRRSDLIQSYRLYTLALNGTPETGAMNRLRESGELTEQGAWRLAAAYAIIGQKDAAEQLVNGITTNIVAYKEQGNTFGNATRDRAMILETLALMERFTQGAGLLKELSSELSSKMWLSTQATAYSLIAIGKFAGTNSANKNLVFDYSIDQATRNAQTELPVVQVPLDLSQKPNGQVSILNKGSGLIYARVVTLGSPLRGTEKRIQSGLTMSLVYKNKDGLPIDIGSMQQGTEFTAEVTVRHSGLTGNYENLAITQIFPSGWEITNTRLNDMENVQPGDAFTYQDIRDDRVYTYFDLNRGKSKTFKVLLNASFSGEYYLPAVSCEAMYDDQVRAVLPGQGVTVFTGGIN